MGLDYYYKIYVVKPGGVYGAGSNEVAGKTDYIRTYPFSDDLENEASTLENWDLYSWGRTNDSAHSGSYSLADSPGSDYSNNQVKSLTTAIDLSSAQIPQLRFWQKYSLGNGDYATIEVSTDLDRTWKCIYYTSGVQLNWHQIKVDLSQYRGNANVRLRFKLTSDGSDIGGGWNIDDVTIAETLTPLIDFPASDGAEDTDTQIDWSPSCWYKSPEAAHTGQYGWQTSPYVSGQYCLTSPPINLGNANNPQLVFWSHDYYNYSGRYVEIKSNQDSTWTRVLSLPNPNTGVWNRYQLDLSQYKGMEISVRFVTGNGLWKIDDIGISESGNDVVLNPVSNPTRHSLDLTWNAYEGADFVRYEIRRTKTPGVTITSPLIASISDPQQTSYIDNNLEMGLEYYYKIFVVELGEVYSAGSNEISAKTDYIRNYPFYDDMEDEVSTSNNWDLYTWGRTSKVSHGGSYSLADSPGSDYGNNQIRSLTTTVDLSTSRIPQLRYWQRYSLGSGDCISIEVSTDLERSWTCIYSSSGAQLNWEQVTLDLTPYGGKSCVRLRFKLTSDNTDIADGWEIDDVTIGEISSPVISLPASDGAEDTDTQINWSSSNWYRSTEAAHTGQYGWKNDTSIRGNYYLTSSPISLRNTNNPQLVFWSQDYSRSGGYQFVEISTNLGRSWTRLVNMANSPNTVWNRYQVDLTPYKGTEVSLRFVNYCYLYQIDDIKIVERPVDVSLQLPSGITRTQMDLNWTQSKDPNFIRYEIRRSHQANVTVNSEHIASITDPTQLTFTDTNLTMGLLYYYKVFVVATGDVYSLGSNEVFANTANVKQYPFYDDFSNNSGNWNFNKWGIIADTDENQYAYSDGYCLTNLPKPYQPNQDMTATTVLDLSMAKMPVLEFWHKYTLGNGDHGYVEVSLDSSSTWQRLYHITTSSIEYTKAEIDLSAFAGRSRVMLRFRLTSDGSDNADGWYVDNVSVADTGVPLIALPLTENAERTESEVYWFNADWFKSGWAAHTGNKGWQSQNIYGALTTANNIDLKQANNPQLIFWTRYQAASGYYFGVDISTNNGITWNRICTLPYTNIDTNWSRYQIDLSPYKGQEIRMRFSRTGSYDRWWHLDDISISDNDTILPGITNDLRIDSVLPRSISIKWSAAGDDGYSGRAYQYDVRYATVEITPENWDTATPVAIVPLPGLPSTRETLTVNGLEPNTK